MLMSNVKFIYQMSNVKFEISNAPEARQVRGFVFLWLRNHLFQIFGTVWGIITVIGVIGEIGVIDVFWVIQWLLQLVSLMCLCD